LTDEYINRLFEGTNFGGKINNCVKAKRRQILKTLKDQVAGYWSGHTAYHLVVDGGFLHDAKTDEEKKLTALGIAFINTNGDL